MSQGDFPIKVKVGCVTVKIYKTTDRGTERHTVVWHEAGLRHLKQFVALSEAKKIAKETASRIEAGRGGTVEVSGKERDEFVYVKAKLKSFDIPLTSVVDEWIECQKVDVPLLAACQYYKAKHHATLPQKPVADVVAEFLETKRQDGMSHYYLHDCKCRLGKFSQDMKINISEIDPQTIDSWLRNVQGSGRTRNNYRGILITLFRFARSRGYLAKNEPTAADELAKAKYVSKAVGIYTPQEFSTLLNYPDGLTDAPRECIVPFFVLGGLCGLRHVETTRMVWEDIDFAQMVVRVAPEKSKTASHRLVPICDSAATWLKPYAGKGTICTENQSRCARYLAINHGVQWERNGLRHSYGTYRLAVLKDVAALALEMGNSPKVIFQHYRKPVTEQDAKLYFSIMPPEKIENVLNFQTKKKA